MRTYHTNDDIFDIALRQPEPCAVCITTNGCTRKNGNGIMGAGIAKQCLSFLPDAEIRLGQHLNQNGNIIGELGQKEKVTFLSFPTKNDYRNNSDMNLICQSCCDLLLWKNQHPEIKYILMPPPGCGLGGLDWNEVGPVISKILNDRNILIILKNK